jgi:hypothetical protein
VSGQEAHAARQPNEGHLARVGYSQFQPTLRKAANRLATVHTPEGAPLPPNVSAGLQRDMAREGFVLNQSGKSRRLVRNNSSRSLRAARSVGNKGSPESGNARVHAVWEDLLKLQRARSFRREVERANDDLDLLAVFGWLAFEEP